VVLNFLTVVANTHNYQLAGNLFARRVIFLVLLVRSQLELTALDVLVLNPSSLVYLSLASYDVNY
jgi:hypothetical protein